MLPVTIARKVMARGIIKHLKRMYAGAPDELHILHIQRMHILKNCISLTLHILKNCISYLYTYLYFFYLCISMQSHLGAGQTRL